MLLLVVPQLLRWTGTSGVSRYAWGTLLLTIGAMWLGRALYGHPDAPAVDELVNWMLVVALPALAVYTWPPLRLPPQQVASPLLVDP